MVIYDVAVKKPQKIHIVQQQHQLYTKEKETPVVKMGKIKYMCL